MVIGLRVPDSPCRDGRLPQVSHVSLTDRVDRVLGAVSFAACDLQPAGGAVGRDQEH